MNITIYSTSTCNACTTLTEWLGGLGFKYTKKITDEDRAVMAEFMSVNDGMISVPFTIIKDNHGKVTKVSGFDQAKFKQILGSS